MRYYGNVAYIVESNEIMWLIIGLVAGAAIMAVVDFIIDRRGHHGDKEKEDKM